MNLDAAIDVARGDFSLQGAFSVSEGEVLALLGPNGSGKSTALHVIAGLLPLDAGYVTIDGNRVDDPALKVFLPPEERRVSLVFQDYLLFPHLSVWRNVAFGLRAKGEAKTEAEATARDWLTRLGLADKAELKPRELSGGQAQRVALARALAPSPRLLLLDEPMAALDVAAHNSVRHDLRHHLRDFGGGTVLVTHDPIDALALADRIVILEGGRVTQMGSPDEITRRPRTRYVADLIGLNLLRGSASGHSVALREWNEEVAIAEAADGDVIVLIPPDAVSLYVSRPEGSLRNLWPGRITAVDVLGDRARIRLEGRLPLIAEVTPQAVVDLELREGREVWAGVKATEVTAYPE